MVISNDILTLEWVYVLSGMKPAASDGQRSAALRRVKFR